jgi:hypothetical protein
MHPYSRSQHPDVPGNHLLAHFKFTSQQLLETFRHGTTSERVPAEKSFGRPVTVVMARIMGACSNNDRLCHEEGISNGGGSIFGKRCPGRT